jgi:dolichol-phosphate mannosyltransferase
MTPAPRISVVSALYRTAGTAAELVARLRRALDRIGLPWEIVLIDDACPQNSSEQVVGSDERLRIYRLSRNVGQLSALLIGLELARGATIVVLDSDLQDDPADIERLVKVLDSGCDVGVAGRRGRYTSVLRRFTGIAFRRIRSVLALGRIPPDAGLFFAARSTAIDRLLALNDPGVHPLSGLAIGRVTTVSVPIQRAARRSGRSSYSVVRRIQVATVALLEVTPLYPIVRKLRRRRWQPPAVSPVSTARRTSEP